MMNRSGSGIPTIVEGRNDKEALRVLKIPGKIMCLKASSSSFYDFTASVAHNREVTILTDFDREGTRLAAKLMHELTHMGVKVDFTIWKKL